MQGATKPIHASAGQKDRPQLEHYQAIYLARVLAQLLNAGIPLLGAIEQLKGINWSQDFEKMQAALKEGKLTSESLPARFPPVMKDLVAVGEESGQLPTMLHSGANLLEENLSHQIETVMSILEPVLCATFGVVIGGLFLSCLIPLVHLMNQI